MLIFPQVNFTLANNDCGLLTDVTIDVSQDAGEIDMASSLFVTDGGSFDLSSFCRCNGWICNGKRGF